MKHHQNRGLLAAAVPFAATFAFVVTTASSSFAQLTTKISADPEGVPVEWLDWSYYQALSQDERWLAFRGGGNVYVRDLTTGRLTVASVALPGAGPFGGGDHASISADGRYTAYESLSDSLVVGDTNGASDIFVFDRVNKVVRRVSEDSQGNQGHGHSIDSVISGDGSTVAFHSWSTNLVPNDHNSRVDVFVRDLATNAVTRANVSSTGQEGQCSSPICVDNYQGLSLSFDGNLVAFGSSMTNLVSGDTNLWPDVFVRDRMAGTTERISVSAAGLQGDDFSQNPVLSCDGRYVAFDSYATNLVPSDTNGAADVFVRDRWSGTLERVSLDSAGHETGSVWGGSAYPAVSCDGRFVAFESDATDVVHNDTNGTTDVFLRDLLAGTTRRVSLGVGASEVSFGGYVRFLTVTDEGRVVFGSSDPRLSVGDSSDSFDVFVHDPSLPASAIKSYCTPKTNSLGCSPRIMVTGYPSLSDPMTLFISTLNARSQQSGMLIWSLNSVGGVPFHGGWLCVSSPIRRTAVQSSDGSAVADCSGRYTFHFSPQYLASESLSAGTVVNCQFRGRDSGFAWPENVELTDAVRFTVLP